MERSTAAVTDDILRTLVSRGWCFRSSDRADEVVKQLMSLVDAEARPGEKKGEVVDLVELELLCVDLRSFGGKSLPDSSTLKKRSSLQGPKVLQVLSVRDICLSSTEATFKNSQSGRRLLRFVLTDGNVEVTAVEYALIPAIKTEIIPGTKVRLENKVAVHNGILCLNPNVFTVIGGVVQSLFEEWEMDQKYSGISRSNLKPSGPSHDSEGAGPPPFEKLKLQGHSFHHRSSQPIPGSKDSPSSKFDGKQGQGSQSLETSGKGKSVNSDHDNINNITKVASTSNKNGGIDITSEARAKEAIEAMPVQNQAAAQKLLLKMNHPNNQDMHHRGNRQRGKGKKEETPVFTLDEWERRKTGTSLPPVSGEKPDVSHDEEFAWQLQQQLDLENCQVQESHQAESEMIRMNMFCFERTQERNDSRRGSRGRRRGRGRGGRRTG